ncbi:hypothetical protein M409DRAFT_21643 [Zasmidium cellare ATCC 36951]|uniref:Uncharacterized protein n=1 Tax=Zasmidium cellare ATCC 36951 TaxID=1080233 RepID=A0A6A6CQZ5_ZASCE|nr:uncharacterized protein M409DRAFT_21643 [Zasmidium cellare ATCC 36951]KAF2168199.1 hypothetical protein M409DRAFT_21643 [Zasmidium cellare ATCC 36951]
MAASSQHIRKRQFQPSTQTTLNSYFNRNADDASLERSRSPMSPPLPAETEASLLNVGMRIRKSLPEGYKTHKTIGQAGFPFHSSAPSASSAPIRPPLSPMRSNELQPFCGLHKIGGWAAQETPFSSAPPAMRGQQEEDDDMPGLSTSQHTLHSTQSSFASAVDSKKRTFEDGYEDDAEDAMDAFFDEAEDVTTIPAKPAQSRPMARMKPTARKAAPINAVRIFGEDDFEEATFLVPMEE